MAIQGYNEIDKNSWHGTYEFGHVDRRLEKGVSGEEFRELVRYLSAYDTAMLSEISEQYELDEKDVAAGLKGAYSVGNDASLEFLKESYPSHISNKTYQAALEVAVQLGDEYAVNALHKDFPFLELDFEEVAKNSVKLDDSVLEKLSMDNKQKCFNAEFDALRSYEQDMQSDLPRNFDAVINSIIEKGGVPKFEGDMDNLVPNCFDLGFDNELIGKVVPADYDFTTDHSSALRNAAELDHMEAVEWLLPKSNIDEAIDFLLGENMCSPSYSYQYTANKLIEVRDMHLHEELQANTPPAPIKERKLAMRL